MNCLPFTAIGTLLDKESFRIAISQRLGLPVCAPHKCRCGAIVDRYGLHPLSCRFSAGRLPRHSALNDIIKRALSSSGFNAVLETVGHDGGDGKRPDGMTVFPFSRGKSLIWDSTCFDSFPPQLWFWLQLSLDQHLAKLKYAGALCMKGYVIDTFFKQSPLNLLMCLDEILTPSFPDWVTLPPQLAVNVVKLNFSANIFHLQQFVETPNLYHMLAAQAHELGLPCVICELRFVKITICIFHKLIDILPMCHINEGALQ